MIDFRCWYCNRRYWLPEQRIGERLSCSCKHELRVPKRSGGNCRVKALADWFVEALVYGGGGAVLGLLLSLLIMSQATVLSQLPYTGMIVPGLTVLGFLGGLLGGERFINWV